MADLQTYLETQPMKAPPKAFKPVERVELKAPRTLVIEDRGKHYTLTFGRITEKQWLAYFKAIVNTSENRAGKRVDNFDASGAQLALVESALVTASGYPVPEGKKSIDQIAGWKAMLPLRHSLRAGETLVSVSVNEQDSGDEVVFGQDSVYLDTTWSADESGMMRRFKGLRHDFKMPSAEEQRRFARDDSRSVIVGGSRSAKTVWGGSQPTLIELYNELIVSVDGYTVDGEVPDRDAIVEWMDARHKVAAASVLFSPAAPMESPKADEDGD